MLLPPTLLGRWPNERLPLRILGYVLMPNVNPLVEMMDMREAQRSYEANMNVISTSRQMVAKTLELLK